MSWRRLSPPIWVGKCTHTGSRAGSTKESLTESVPPQRGRLRCPLKQRLAGGRSASGRGRRAWRACQTRARQALLVRQPSRKSEAILRSDECMDYVHGLVACRVMYSRNPYELSTLAWHEGSLPDQAIQITAGRSVGSDFHVGRGIRPPARVRVRAHRDSRQPAYQILCLRHEDIEGEGIHGYSA